MARAIRGAPLSMVVTVALRLRKRKEGKTGEASQTSPEEIALVFPALHFRPKA